MNKAEMGDKVMSLVQEIKDTGTNTKNREVYDRSLGFTLENG